MRNALDAEQRAAKSFPPIPKLVYMPRQSTAAEKVLEHIRRLQLHEQARLPPERELAGALRLSRAQLRTGLAKLKASGRIWGAVGRGTFVGRQPAIEPTVGLRLVALANPRELMEARLALEPMLASLAAVHASPMQISALEKHVRLAGEARDRAGFRRNDDAFHRGIAEAAGNRILLALYTAVMECKREEGLGTLGQRILTNERREAYHNHHSTIVAAIRDRHAARAAAAMRQHLEVVAAACDIFGAAAKASGAN